MSRGSSGSCDPVRQDVGAELGVRLASGPHDRGKVADDADGFGPWTVKLGLIQIEPPFDILERMVTLRVHLDQVDANNAPLRIVPGSDRLGRLNESEVHGVVATSDERLCLAERGDVWLYAPPIVHASLAADPPQRRRVLQIDYSADAAPYPLAWHGI